MKKYRGRIMNINYHQQAKEKSNNNNNQDNIESEISP